MDSTQETKLIEDFLNEHDRGVQCIQQNPDTPASHPQTGDQSWPFGGGRYRLFFKVVKDGEEIKIYFTDLIDSLTFYFRYINKTVNLNKIISRLKNC